MSQVGAAQPTVAQKPTNDSAWTVRVHDHNVDQCESDRPTPESFLPFLRDVVKAEHVT